MTGMTLGASPPGGRIYQGLVIPAVRLSKRDQSHVSAASALTRTLVPSTKGAPCRRFPS